jgi:hypothetical protein
MNPPSIITRTRLLTRVDLSPRHKQPSAGSLAVATVLSVALALLADALLVVIGTATFPSTSGYQHFQFGDYSTLTVAGVIFACIAWPIVTRLTSAPRWLFFRLAVLVTAALLLPDLGIWVQGAPGRAVVVLVAMHLAIGLITYNVLVHIARTRSNKSEPQFFQAQRDS